MKGDPVVARREPGEATRSGSFLRGAPHDGEHEAPSFSRDCRPEGRPRCSRRPAPTPQSQSIGRGCPAGRSPVPWYAATTGRQRGTHVNKTELPARVATRASLSRAGAHAGVNALFSAVADALAGGETVTIAGFGTFRRNHDRHAGVGTPAPARASPS